MEQEVKSATYIIITTLIFIVVVLLTIAMCINYTNDQYLKAGLQECPLLGTSQTVWQKDCFYATKL
jgi:hypothetical protein